MNRFFILTIILISLYCCITNTSAQSFNPFYQSTVTNVSYDTILKNLQKFQALGIKEPGTTALNNTRDWLIEKYTEYGYSNIQVDTFSVSGHEMYNIIITKTGTLYPDTFVIVDGHYDTHTGTGTNDNGTGTVILLETARILKDINTEYSVKFIHFSGEEIGLTGSTHYVNNVENPENMKIRIVFNIDEVGGIAGLPNDTIRCESDQSNPNSNNAISDAFTDTLMNLTEMYSSLKTIKTNAYGSDYVPFQQNGDIITGYYEYDESPYPHSSGDNLAHLDTSYVYEITKAAAASTMYFARAYDVSVNNHEITDNSDLFIFYPNPFHDKLFIHSTEKGKQYNFSLFTFKGQLVYRNSFIENSVLSIPNITPSLYLYEIYNEKGIVISRGKLFSY